MPFKMCAYIKMVFIGHPSGIDAFNSVVKKIVIDYFCDRVHWLRLRITVNGLPKNVIGLYVAM